MSPFLLQVYLELAKFNMFAPVQDTARKASETLAEAKELIEEKATEALAGAKEIEHQVAENIHKAIEKGTCRHAHGQ